MKRAILALAAIALGAAYGLPAGPGWLGRALRAATVLVGAIPAGTILFPALLPWLPSRAFSVKGAVLGAAWAAAAALALHMPGLSAIGAVLISAPTVAFLAMNFTGSSTYTCQPGALLEVERGFWPMVASAAVGLAASVASRVLGA